MKFRSMGAPVGSAPEKRIFSWLSEGLSTVFYRRKPVIIGKVGLPGEAGPGSLCNVLLTASCLTRGITNTGLHTKYVCVISQQRCQWWGMAGKGS